MIELDAQGRNGNRGPYMHSSNGRKIYPFDPREEELDITVIAHHLACNNRWNGATQHKRFKSRISFSVAEHSVLVMKYLVEVMERPDLELEALMHDAPEYLLSDMIRPIKHDHRVYPVYKPLEDRAEQVIARRFGLIYPLPKEVKIADDAVCAAEAQEIVPKDTREDWSKKLHDDTAVAPYEIEMMEAYRAKEYFLLAYEDAARRRPNFASLPSSVAL